MTQHKEDKVYAHFKKKVAHEHLYVEKPRASFVKMKKILCRRELSIDLRIRMLRYSVFPVLYYGVKTWNLNKIYERKRGI